MNNQSILDKKKEVLQYLSKRQLKNAIELLALLVTELQDWTVSEKLKELETNYRLLLHYQFEDVNDPEQKNVYNNLIRLLYEINDDVVDGLLMERSTNLYFERLRINNLREKVSVHDYYAQLKKVTDSISLAGLMEDAPPHQQDQMRLLSVKRERIASDMFTSVYVAPRLSAKELEEYKMFLGGNDINEREKCLFLSALTLNLIRRFDGKIAGLIMDMCTDKNPMLSQRAIVGLIIILQMYDIRWKLYPECIQHLESLSEDMSFRKSVLTVVKQLIRSRETEQISKKLNEEIIPEMLRFNSLAGRKLDMEDLFGDGDFSEKNPEWKKELESSGLADKLQEYSNLQMEGADVFHSTFSNLKNFPFFSDLGNWFLPFDPTYSELQPFFSKAEKDSLLYTAILNSGHMCNSDKYSFCFSLLQLPEAQREMMLHRFGDESEQIKQMQKEAEELNSGSKEETISNQYIQDLYRFFKLHPSRRSFIDIFKLRINFYDKKSIAPLISEMDDMKQIAQYCFEKNFFAEALWVYLLLVEQTEVDSDIWQKIGYCRQMINDPEGALNAYLQADLFGQDNTWTLRRIAQLYRSLKKPELALEYYQKLQSLHPGNLSIELNIGHCYLDMREYERALNSYFKVEMQDEEKTGNRALRPVAWTAFLLERFDLAQKYYEKILSGKPSLHDYLNAGHVELAMDNKKQALVLYRESLAMLDNNVEKFADLFNVDEEELLSVGVEKDFLPLLFDELRFKIS